VFFDHGDADFELLAFVDFVLLELGELGVEAIDGRRGKRTEIGSAAHGEEDGEEDNAEPPVDEGRGTDAQDART
jgi:hypothetical protein